MPPLQHRSPRRRLPAPPLRPQGPRRSRAPGGTPERPVVPPGISEFFVPPPAQGRSQGYAPGMLGAARVRFSDRALGVDSTDEALYLAA